MSSPMTLRTGQVLRGAKGSYELLRSLERNVFKARVLSSRAKKPEWAVIKTATSDRQKTCLRRELNNYRIKEIAASPYFRALRDTIPLENSPEDPPCLVLEWMDHDLDSVYDHEFRSDPKLPRIVSKAVLSALSVLKSLNAVHTAIDTTNVLISDLNGSSPTVKVGNLGKCTMDGSATKRKQRIEYRAPEVWQGVPCGHVADVWSLAVMLTTMLSPLMLFGNYDNCGKEPTASWCIAKIIRLVGPIGPPRDNAYNEEFALAKELETMVRPSGVMNVITWPHWRASLEYLSTPPVPKDLLDFIESLLVIDPNKRPTASEALQHHYLQRPFDATITKWEPKVHVPQRGDYLAVWNGTDYILRQDTLQEKKLHRNARR